jgi:hypothetical protein
MPIMQKLKQAFVFERNMANVKANKSSRLKNTHTHSHGIKIEDEHKGD